MNERGFLLVGLMMAGVILSFAIVVVIYSLPRYSTDLGYIATNSASSNSGGGTPTDLINQANSVKIQADLKSIQTSMIAYYAEQGTYPSSLQELNSYMEIQTDTTNIMYVTCSVGSIVLYHNSSGYPGYIFNEGQSSPLNGSSPPSCN